MNTATANTFRGYSHVDLDQCAYSTYASNKAADKVGVLGTSQTRQREGLGGSRRSKYIARACQDCQRRKVKCSGDDTCTNCQKQGISCVYLPRSDMEPRRKRPRANHSRSQGFGEAPTLASRARSQESEQGRPDPVSLADRVKQLQETVEILKRDVGSSQEYEIRQDVRAAAAAPYTMDLSPEGENAVDTYHNGSGDSNVSLSAQLAVMQKLSNPNTCRRRMIVQDHQNKRVFPLELPPPSVVKRLLGIHFREIDPYFPFMEQSETERRISQALDKLGYSEIDLIIEVGYEHHAIIALLCNLLVLGFCHDPETNNLNDVQPAWSIYNRGRKLLQHCGSLRTTNTDIVGYHVLSAIYMMHMESLMSASHAISIAAQLATAARLNVQSSWVNFTPAEVQARQRLWWTIYILDRRITQRQGMPYLVRDSEISVLDFEQQVQSQSTFQSQGSGQAVSGGQADWLQSLETSRYLQSSIELARLWTFVWDTFYSARVAKPADWKEILLTDTRIMIFKKSLPAELLYDTDRMSDQVVANEGEPQIRRRLSIFLKINLLRMIIRQNPALSTTGDAEGRSLCITISHQSIDAIAAYWKTSPQIPASVIVHTTALVECIFHLVYALHDNSNDDDRSAATVAFARAHGLLRDFAANFSTAKRALRALSMAIHCEGDSTSVFNAVTRPGSDQPGHEKSTSTMAADALGVDIDATNYQTTLGSFFGAEFNASGSGSVTQPTFGHSSFQNSRQDMLDDVFMQNMIWGELGADQLGVQTR